jgi:integrase
MAEITRADLQRRVGASTAGGSSASKVKNTINAARLLFRDFNLVSGTDNPLVTDPTHGLRLPHYGGKRDRIADPDEAGRLIEALVTEDRALWATAMDAGLRHGELKALRCEDLDLEHGRIYVRRGWDQCQGEIDRSRRPARARPASAPASGGCSRSTSIGQAAPARRMLDAGRCSGAIRPGGSAARAPHRW